MHYAKISISFLLVTCLMLSCSGCKLGGKYKQPPVEIPYEWKTTPNQAITDYNPAPFYWWDVFNDPILSQLEEQAISNNPNLLAAIERIMQARAIAGIDKASLYPQINLAPSYSNMESLFKIYLPNNVFPNTPTLNTPFRAHQLQYVLPLNLSYEVDLWGKLRNQYDSDLFAVESQTENYFAAMLSLTGDVANNYLIMRILDSQLDILEENIVLLQAVLGLNESRYKKGLGNEFTVLDAKQQLYDAQASIANIVRQRNLQENIIATLIGVPAANFTLSHQPLNYEPPQIPAGLPSEILLKRPDIAAAERTMASQHALIGVAYASFFPSLQLTGTLGYLSPDLGQFLSWQSRLWALGANAAQTIFDAGRNCQNLALTRAQYCESVFNYQQTVLVAFQEVEDALVNLEGQSIQYSNNLLSYQISQKRVELVHRQNITGYANTLDVLSKQLTELQARLNLLLTLGSRYQSTIQLIKSLGGSWSTQTASEEPGSSGQGEDCDDCHWPNISQDDI